MGSFYRQWVLSLLGPGEDAKDPINQGLPQGLSSYTAIHTPFLSSGPPRVVHSENHVFKRDICQDVFGSGAITNICTPSRTLCCESLKLLTSCPSSKFQPQVFDQGYRIRNANNIRKKDGAVSRRKSPNQSI